MSELATREAGESFLSKLRRGEGGFRLDPVVRGTTPCFDNSRSMCVSSFPPCFVYRDVEGMQTVLREGRLGHHLPHCARSPPSYPFPSLGAFIPFLSVLFGLPRFGLRSLLC